MKKHNYSGNLVVFEGLDGSGSSTQVKLLADNLTKEGLDCYTTKEPTNNLIGGLIRGQLTGEWQIGMEGLQLLFAADRAHHLKREVIPALESGKTIICDRYLFSSIAFGALELNQDWLVKINEKFILPDLTIILKVSPDKCIKRMKESRLGLEFFEEKKKLEKVWQNYRWLASEFKNVEVVDGERSIDKIGKEVLEIVTETI